MSASNAAPQMAGGDSSDKDDTEDIEDPSARRSTKGSIRNSIRSSISHRKQSIIGGLQAVKAKVEEEKSRIKEVLEDSKLKKSGRAKKECTREDVREWCSLAQWKKRACCYQYSYKYHKCCCGLGDLSQILLAGAIVIFLYDLYLTYTNCEVLQPEGWDDPINFPFVFMNKVFHPAMNTLFSCIGIFGVAAFHVKSVKVFAEWLVFTAAVRLAFVIVSILVFTPGMYDGVGWARIGEQFCKVIGSIWLAQLNWAFQILVRKKIITPADPTGQQFSRSGCTPEQQQNYNAPEAVMAVRRKSDARRGSAANRRGSAVDRERRNSSVNRRNSSLHAGAKNNSITRKGSVNSMTKKGSATSMTKKGSFLRRSSSFLGRNSLLEQADGSNGELSDVPQLTRKNSVADKLKSMVGIQDEVVPEGGRIVGFSMIDPSNKLPTAEETDLIITDEKLTAVSMDLQGGEEERVIHSWDWKIISKCFVELSNDEDLMDVFSFSVEGIGEFQFECDRPDTELLQKLFKNGVEYKETGPNMPVCNISGARLMV